MTQKRPKLNKNISTKDFQDFYWLKVELVDFCREIGISGSGGKIEIAGRIEKYLKTGKIENKKSKNGGKKRGNIQKTPENINEVIPDNYTSSQLFREYFKSIIGQHFHFTAYMKKYMETHPGITFKEYVNEWQAEYERRKNKNYHPKIMKSCEYNQYIRDFFKDNPNKTRNEAIKYWKIKKSTRGNNIYKKSDINIQ
ncbi:SAP domain-containing protein [bacterium]|nr:SAP domain-containing protein [bacterium]